MLLDRRGGPCRTWALQGFEHGRRDNRGNEVSRHRVHRGRTSFSTVLCFPRHSQMRPERDFVGTMCKGYYSCYPLSMTPRKRRLTVTVDPELIEAGNRAVASGAAESLSAWVSLALYDKARRDQQLKHLRDAIADYEAEFGEIRTEDIAAQRRADREDAVVVRGRTTRASGRTGTTRKAKSA